MYRSSGAPPLVIGCPVRDRLWILPRWFEHVGAACEAAKIKPEFIFAVGRDDHDTQDALLQGGALLHAIPVLIFTDEPFEEDRRVWNLARYKHLASLRNRLLTRVREMSPELYLSLDSDLLLEPEALLIAKAQVAAYAALGFKTYMTPQGINCTSHAQLVDNMLRSREDASEGCFPVDVIMAAKLMTEPAYWIDYDSHPQGEDVGWSAACHQNGLRLGWSADARAKHVMHKSLLDSIDPRLGW